VPQKRISVIRKSKGFRRKDSIRETSLTMLIVCEGLTEELYFKNLRSLLGLKTTEIIIADNKKDSAPINLVKKAEELHYRDDGYDNIFCVFDKDQHQSFHAARSKIQKLSSQKRMPIPIEEAVSIPCFEFWVLLHFKKTDMAFKSSHEIIELLSKNRHIKHYRKCDVVLMKTLMEKVDIALQNAIWLEKLGHIQNENPMTSVHKLVQKMKDFQAKFQL
jgi:hypothetical protein